MNAAQSAAVSAASDAIARVPREVVNGNATTARWWREEAEKLRMELKKPSPREDALRRGVAQLQFIVGGGGG